MKCSEGFAHNAEVQRGFVPKLSNVSGRRFISVLKSQCESHIVDRPFGACSKCADVPSDHRWRNLM